MRFKDHFSTQAQAYSRYRPLYPRELFAWLASVAPAHELAWDSATGSGQAALELAAHFERVVATDASARQIAHARPHPGVEYAVCKSEATALEAGSVDLVLVAQALHWFELPAFYAETRRVCRDGAALAVCGYGLLAIEPAIDEIVGRFYADTLGPYWPPERALVDRGYRDLPFPFEAVATPAFTMTQRWRLEDLIGYFGSWSALARYREATGSDPLGALADSLASVWGDPARQRETSWPLFVMVGRVSSATGPQEH